MLTSTSRTESRAPLESVEGGFRARRSTAGRDSNATLSDALAQALIESGDSASNGSLSGVSVPSRQKSAPAPPTSQNPVTTDAAYGWSLFTGKWNVKSGDVAAPGTPAGTEPSPAPPAPQYATKAEADAAVVQALKNALASAGISFDGLGLAAHEDIVTYPGGSYINRYISVNTNGHMEGLMTDLVAINPNVAVLDIKHMLGLA